MYTNYHNRGKTTTTKSVAHILNESLTSNYWLGFIYANSNYFSVKREVRGVRVLCTEEDSEHLKQLGKYLGFKISPVLNKTSNNYSLSIYSQELTEILDAIGCHRSMRDRELVGQGAFLIDKSEFWRGYADGNGMIFTGEEIEDTQFRIQTYPGLLRSFTRYLQSNRVNDAMYHLYPTKLFTEITLIGETALRMLELIYLSQPSSEGSIKLLSPRMERLTSQAQSNEQQPFKRAIYTASTDEVISNVIDGRFRQV